MSTPDELEAWYARSYPGLPVPDGRCLKVLTALAPTHRLPIVTDRLADEQLWDADETASGEREPITDPIDYKYDPLPGGGITAIANRGLRVVMRPGHSMATFDMDELTRLVLAAHQWLCRVEISTAHRESNDPVGVELAITPRKKRGPTSSLFEYHPSLADLAERAASAEGL